MRLSYVTFQQDWYLQGRGTAIVIGNGPSMLTFDPLELDKPYARSLVANGGYKLFPRADVLMCTDRRWLAANPDLSGYQGPGEIIVTRPEAIARPDPRMVLLHRRFIGDAKGDIFARRDTLVEGWTSTTTMISTAVLRGARRIVLLGVDLAPGADGRRRIYDDLRDKPSVAAKRYARQVQHLTMQADWVRRRGIEVINCSPRSALECYPYGRWEELKWPRP